MKTHCSHYQADECRSCSQIELNYAEQINSKQQILLNTFSDPVNFSETQFLDPVTSPAEGFRNKAKMVVLGAAHEPTLGITNHRDEIVDLTDCLLYSPEMIELLQYLQTWIRTSGITPYQINKQKGELKYILLTQNSKSEFMLRFVLKSLKLMERFEQNLPKLQEGFPQIKCISFNLQPEHKAILEGPEEIFYTEKRWINQTLNDIPLCISPQSFFQTNTQLAGALYQQASDWILEQISPNTTLELWDLFCGVGGFGLTLAHKLSSHTSVNLTGIEISPQAIECAQWTAKQLNIASVEFEALDLTQGSSVKSTPEVLIVNPPRRGVGHQITEWIESTQPQWIVYSSCLIESLAHDLSHLPSYQLVKAQVFDLFPNTHHFETLTLLQRRD